MSFRPAVGSGVASLPCDWLEQSQTGGFGERSLPFIEGDKIVHLELARAGHMHDIQSAGAEFHAVARQQTESLHEGGAVQHRKDIQPPLLARTKVGQLSFGL